MQESELELPDDPQGLFDDDGDEFGLSDADRLAIESLLRVMDKREREALKLYEPMPWQDKFHAETCPMLIVQKANHVGGSVCGCIEDARAVLGRDPYHKYPEQDGILMLLGFGENHIGRVFHKYLFRPGAFDIIRDRETKKWRPYRPWPHDVQLLDKWGDLDREEEKFPAPPLIPESMVEAIAWVKKPLRVFAEARLKTGWQIYALNSAGDFGQAQGFRVNLIHIDEDLATAGWGAELVGRMSRGCLLRWTALPHTRTDDITSMIDQAEAQEGRPNPTVKKLKVTIYDNVYLDEETRELKVTSWKAQGEDVYRKRALGELTTDSVQMYPTFSEQLHDAIRFLSDEDKQVEQDGGLPRHPVQKILTERMGQPPPDWTRYVTFDPGFTVGAAVFWCVPPPQVYGDYKIAYDELHIERCTADAFGRAMEMKCKDAEFQDFIIDMHGASLRQMASGVLPLYQYEEALRKVGVRSLARGFRFTPGSDDVKGREMMFRSWLDVNADGWPKFMIVAKRCPHTCRSIRNFKKRTTRVQGKDVAIDEGNRRGDVHNVECCEYGAAHGLPYIKPPVKRRSSPVVERVLAQRKKKALRRRMLQGVDRGGISLSAIGES